jgi:hypothetical protein
MPSKEEKKTRRVQTLKLKEQTHARIEAGLPISKEQFRDLFNWLDETLSKADCDHSLTRTRQFLIDRNLPVEVTSDWLATHGGFCDCEVLANTEEELSGIV